MKTFFKLAILFLMLMSFGEIVAQGGEAIEVLRSDLIAECDSWVNFQESDHASPNGIEVEPSTDDSVIDECPAATPLSVLEGAVGMGSTFYRPSLSIVFSRLGTRSEDLLFGGIVKEQVPSRFDEYRIQNNTIQYQHPERPQLPEDLDVLQLKKALKDYRAKLIEYENEIDQLNKNNLANAAREIVAQAWGRDAEGNFNLSGLIDRASNSATDSEVSISKLSTDKQKIFTDIADSLLNRLYIMVYEITNVKTYEEHYNQLDASNMRSAAVTGKEFKPVERTSEGWFVDYGTYIYRLNWNDSVAAIFYNDMWLDKSVQESRSTKSQAFSSFNFPLRRIYSRASVALSSQSNDPEFYAKPFAPRRKTMDELLTEVPKSIVDNSLFSASQEIDDFKLRAPLTSAYNDGKSRNLVKLGTKEGVYTDQRFFVYRQDLKKGQTIKKRIGVLRPIDIEDNSGIATGESLPSTFGQQGGKRLYDGDLVEMSEDLGVGVRLGLCTGLSAGLNAGLEYRLSGLYKKKFMRGLYLTADLNYSSIGQGSFFKEEGVDADNFGSDKMNISSSNIYFGICKEVYFTKRGNLHYLPTVGAGASVISVSADVANSASISNTVYFAYIEPMSLGYHFSPTVSLNIRAQFPVWAGQDNWENDATEEALTIDPSLLESTNNGVILFNRESLAGSFVFGLRFKL